MALISATGEYLKVTDIHISNDRAEVSYDIYANVEHRTNGDSEYLNKKTGRVNAGKLQIEIAKTPDVNKSIMDNIITATYEAIKSDTFDFSNWNNS